MYQARLAVPHLLTLQVTHSWPQLPALRAGESSACSLSYCRLVWLCFPCMHSHGCVTQERLL